MWLEVKAVISIIGCFIFAIIIALSGNIIFALLGVMGMTTIMFGDLLVGWKIVKTDAIHRIDPVDINEIIIELHTIDGRERLIKAKKGPLGKYEFMFNGKKASVLDDGKATIRYPNGNPAILAHESFDRNINPKKSKYLEEQFNEHEVNTTQDLYHRLKKLEEANK